MEIFGVFPTVSFRVMNPRLPIFGLESIKKSQKLLHARFSSCAREGLEPAFRVLFSAVFHGVSLGDFHQGSLHPRNLLKHGRISLLLQPELPLHWPVWSLSLFQ
jgi:hypothetical protein